MNKQRLPLFAAGITFLIHLVANPHYGFFRDELYFIICGQHPAWGYVDQPPVAPLLAAGSQLFGHSLLLLRAVPALFSAASIYVTCLLIAELGGTAFAMLLGATVAFFAPVLMNFGMKVSTDMPGLVLWPLMALWMLRLARGADPRLWLAVGAAAGVAFESKYSVLFFAAAMLGGMLLTRERRTLLTPYFLSGVAIAVVIAAPNVLWQAAHAFPMYELLRNDTHGKNVNVGPLLYLVQELLITNIFLAPVWIIGLVELFRTKATRFLAFGYILLIAMMIVLHGKHYYPANVYPILIAAGAVAIGRWIEGLALVRAAALAYAVVGGLIFVPFALPVLGEQQLLAYQTVIMHVLHIKKHTLATEHGRPPQLPADWADMHGWRKLARDIQTIYDALPPATRTNTVVMAKNYGEASAIAFFSPNVPVASGHNQYWLWGARAIREHRFTAQNIIDIGGDCGAREHLFSSARRVDTYTAPYAMPYETNLPIMLCQGLRVQAAQLWPSIKNYN